LAGTILAESTQYFLGIWRDWLDPLSRLQMTALEPTR
jgi:hypothetical protein